jgi:hypothetical protein
MDRLVPVSNCHQHKAQVVQEVVAADLEAILKIQSIYILAHLDLYGGRGDSTLHRLQ